MTRVTINVPPRPYDAVIESGLIVRAGAHLRNVLDEQKKLFVLTPAPVRRRWAKKLMASLSESGFAAKIVEMPDGERHKKLAAVEQLGEKLVALGVERSAVLLAFGGGVTGDMVGFLASIYLRSVDVVQIPTSMSR
jgi:3-dehydroquinate synthase